MADQNLGSAVLELKTDGSGLKSGLASGKADLDKFSQDLRNIGGDLSTYVTAPLVLAGGGALKFASDLTEVQGKFDVVFGSLADSTAQWAEETSKAMNRSKTDFMEAAAGFQDLLVPMGFTREEAAELSKKFTTLGVDIASFNNASDPEAINALRSAIVGSSEPMLRFGVDTRAARVEQELLAMGIKGGYEAATEQQKVLARLNIALSMSKDAIGDAERTAGSFANQMKGLGADLKTAGETIGLILIPYAQQAVGALRDMAAWFQALDPGVQQAIVGIAAAAAAIGPLLIAASKLVAIAGVIQGAGGIAGVGSALSALGTAATGPIGLTIAAVVAVTAAWALWGDKIRDVGSDLATFTGGLGAPTDKIKETSSALLGGFLDKIPSALLAAFPPLTAAIGSFNVAADSLSASAGKAVDLDKLSEAMNKAGVASQFAAEKNSTITAGLKVFEEQIKKVPPAIKKATKEAEDFNKSWIDFSRDSRETEQALQTIIDMVGEEFADAIRNESLPALREVGAQLQYLRNRDAKALADGMRDDIPPAIGAMVSALDVGVSMMIQDINAVGTNLDKIPTHTKDVSTAFGRLQSDSVAELQRLADQAAADFLLIKESGVASQENITEAWRNELAAQIALMKAQGIEIPAEQQRTLDQLNAQLKTGTAQQKGVWDTFGSDVAGVLTGFTKIDIFQDGLGLENWKEKFKGLANTVINNLQKPFVDAFNSMITNGVDKLMGKLTGLSDGITNLFGGGASSAAGSAASTVSGGASSAASTAAGVATSLSNPVTAIASIGSLISGVIGNFQMAKMETTLNAIEESTRRSEIHLGGPAGILNSIHTYLAENEWQRHSEIKERLDNIVTNTAGGGSGGGVTVQVNGPVYGYSSVSALIADINSLVRNDGTTLVASELLA